MESLEKALTIKTSNKSVIKLVKNIFLTAKRDSKVAETDPGKGSAEGCIY
jgi:hypothetical protein